MISTPHSAGNTVEVANHQGESVSAALLQLLRGESPRCVLNPQTLADFDWHRPKRQPDENELARLSSKSGPAVTDLQRDAKAERKQKAAEKPQWMPPRPSSKRCKSILEKFCAGMAADPTLMPLAPTRMSLCSFQPTIWALNFILA